MTSQQTADIMLSGWQDNRQLSQADRLKAAVERLEILMGELFSEPASLMSSAEYDATLRSVSEEMSHG